MRLNEEARKRVWDIAAAGRKIASWVGDDAIGEYLDSPLLRSAVERQFIVIGEALRQALQAETALAGSITDAAKIVGFRNVLVHNYSQINHDEVWSMIQVDLPLLLTECRSLLGGLPA